ncbi:MAG: DUF167 domain-containing protein [Candidatus Marsarchaeota archaeon]|nr:DUF167 domain-containing protein [Candidatus Marsarchaeota archaeon]
MKLNIIATPNAKVPSVSKIDENSYKVKVDAKAIDGKANERLIEILANHFNISKSKISIIAGLKSRKKTVVIFE